MPSREISFYLFYSYWFFWMTIELMLWRSTRVCILLSHVHIPCEGPLANLLMHLHFFIFGRFQFAKIKLNIGA